MERPADRHIEAFLEMLAAERGAARNTLLAYQADLDDFAAYAAARGRPPAGCDPVRGGPKEMNPGGPGIGLVLAVSCHYRNSRPGRATLLRAIARAARRR